MPVYYWLLSLLMISLQPIWAENLSSAIYFSPTVAVTSEVTKITAPEASTRKAADVSFGPVIISGSSNFGSPQI